MRAFSPCDNTELSLRFSCALHSSGSQFCSPAAPLFLPGLPAFWLAGRLAGWLRSAGCLRTFADITLQICGRAGEQAFMRGRSAGVCGPLVVNLISGSMQATYRLNTNPVVDPLCSVAQVVGLALGYYMLCPRPFFFFSRTSN